MLHTEALLFAADRPVTEQDVKDVLTESLQLETEDVNRISAVIEAIIEKYNSDFYPFQVKKSGGGYQFMSKVNFHPLISLLNGSKFRKRLSTSAMETLAIIAYRQPSTKGEIEYIRGVNSDYSVQKLLDLELISICGRKEEAVGRPLLYATTASFLDYLGLDSVEDLPKLKEIQSFEDIIPTNAGEALPEKDESQLVINEKGEIDEINPMDHNKENKTDEESGETSSDKKDLD